MIKNDQNKLYYWIRLKTDFFDLPTIDWLMDQDNGCEYIVLYQKLCLLTANSQGALIRTVGDMIIPYDTKKIAEITKFPTDTVVVALGLYSRIGLIYKTEQGTLIIPGVEAMVGYETQWADKKRKQRHQNKELKKNKDNVLQLSPTLSDKSLESRDKSLEIKNNNRDSESAVVDNYTLHEQSQITPMSDYPRLDNPTLDNPILEKPTQIITNEDISAVADNAIALAGLMQDAAKMGISAITMDRCVDKYGISRVRAVLQIIVQKDAVRNPNGMLIRALQDGWDIDVATVSQQSQVDKDAAIAHNQQLGAQSLTAVYGDIPQVASTGNITQDIAALRDRIAKIGGDTYA